MSDNRLVYSTDGGKIDAPKPDAARSVSADGVVRIQRETKGRKGKGVSVLTGLNMAPDECKNLCSFLKKKCGCGGAVKNGTIEIQTDDREKLKLLLQEKGITAKLAGG
ncbi:stress response translation initiation inhibitor YciH [Alteromonas sp. CYL-A6]|uniref:stress response translation initiation inhibitor YciH n=1 Tax=Alteromonas nitratireducens TaxID=3390813 RepID=UPI0034AA7DB3